MPKINWTEVNQKLPTGKSKEEKARRLKMFRDFDPNGNGVLSLAEVDKSVRDVLKIDSLFDAKPAIMRAFQIAKDSKKSKRGDLGDDYIELREFKYFLLSLRQYFEYYAMFVTVDTNSDKRISEAEFRAAKDQIKAWIPGDQLVCSKVFKEIDANHGGHILFDEFAKWAIKKNLDLEDDDDDIDE